MLVLSFILYVLIIHWVCDFILQSDEQAKEKSTSNAMLLEHTATYTLCWLIVLVLTTVIINQSFFMSLNHIYNLLIFTAVTFVTHTLTDYVTSRINKRLWEKKDTHNFFVMIGFDQILHYIQLFGCIYYIIL